MANSAGNYDNTENLTIDYSTDGNSVILSGNRAKLVNLGYTDANTQLKTSTFKFNANSIWTAAAVNMGLLNFSALTISAWNVSGAPSTPSKSEYGYGYAYYDGADEAEEDDDSDDDTRRRQLLTTSAPSNEPSAAPTPSVTKPTLAPSAKQSTLAPTDPETEVDVKKVDEDKIYGYVYRKFAEGLMDEIQCVQEDKKCFLRVNGAADDDENGLVVFPLIQAKGPTDDDGNPTAGCRTCNGVLRGDRQDCNEPGYEVALFFFKDATANYYYFDHDRDYDFQDVLFNTDALGAFIMEMEGGMKFLNGNYYARRITGGRPSFHCTTDEDPAFTFLKSSANLCKSLSTDGRKDSGTYCGVPPDTLVEA